MCELCRDRKQLIITGCHVIARFFSKIPGNVGRLRPHLTLAYLNKAFAKIHFCVVGKNKQKKKVVRFASILNKVAKALGTIRFSQLLLLLRPHLIHGARKQQASEKDTVKKLDSIAG